VIGGFGLVAAEGAGADTPPGTALDESNTANGVIERIAPPELRLRTAERSISVTLSGDAEVWRDGPAALSDYLVDEEVVAYGEWENGAFAATRVEPLYRMCEGEVVRTRHDRIVTTNGTVLLSPLTRYRRSDRLDASPESKIMPGQHVRALGRRKPKSLDLLGLRIDVE
jgi:hypothetical protein